MYNKGGKDNFSNNKKYANVFLFQKDQLYIWVTCGKRM